MRDQDGSRGFGCCRMRSWEPGIHSGIRLAPSFPHSPVEPPTPLQPPQAAAREVPPVLIIQLNTNSIIGDGPIVRKEIEYRMARGPWAEVHASAQAHLQAVAPRPRHGVRDQRAAHAPG